MGDSDADEEEFHSADEGDENETIKAKSEFIRRKKSKEIVSSPCSDEQMKSCETDWSHRDLCSKFEGATSKVPTTKPSPPLSASLQTSEIPQQENINAQETVESDAEGWNLEDWGSILGTKNSAEKPPKPSSLSLPQAYSTEPKEAGNVKENVDQNPQASKPLGMDENSSSWMNWNWLSSAGGTLTNITSTFGENLSNVIQSVEVQLGAPSPEELARMSFEEKLKLSRKADEVKEPVDWDSSEEAGSEEGGSDTCRSEDASSSGYQSDNNRLQDGQKQGVTGFSQWTSFLESAGKHLVTGSIDVLESLGKKTFEVITEADANSSKRRLKFGSHQPTLSQLLTECKAEQQSRQRSGSQQEDQEPVYTRLFEDYQGLVNLEALEMLSENCQKALADSLRHLTEAQREMIDPELEAFREAMCPSGSNSTTEETDHDFGAVLKEIMAEINLPFNSQRILQSQQMYRKWLDSNEDNKDSKAIYEQSLRCLAELTACSVELVHKLGHLALSGSRVVQPESMAKLSKLLRDELGICSAQFCKRLTALGESSVINTLITNVFLESNNSSGYVQEAFERLVPVFQLTLAQRELSVHAAAAKIQHKLVQKSTKKD